MSTLTSSSCRPAPPDARRHVRAHATSVFCGGSLRMSDEPGGAVMTVAGMIPAEVRTGSVTVQNSGDAVGRFRLELVILSGVARGLEARLQLTITEGTTLIYLGALNGLAHVDLGFWQPREQHSYTFTLSLPDDGTGDNDSLRGTLAARFGWGAVGISDAPA